MNEYIESIGSGAFDSSSIVSSFDALSCVCLLYMNFDVPFLYHFFLFAVLKDLVAVVIDFVVALLLLLHQMDQIEH